MRILIDTQVFVPEPDYLLAMKAIAARSGTYDREDVVRLIEMLGIKSAEAVFDIVEKYYPKNQIMPATQYFVEQLFQDEHGG